LVTLSAPAREPATTAWRKWVVARLRGVGRADLAVLGFCALGAGNVWARHGTGNADVQASPAQFIVGFALIALAAIFCFMAISRPASLPGAALCTVAIAAQTCLEPTFLLAVPQVYAVGLIFAVVPLVRSSRIAWLLIAGASAVTAAAMATAWTWGTAPIDVFTEVQGATAALLHGHNPYSPVFSVFLDTQNGHAVYGSAALCYGPMVVLLSLPARLLGDVRLTVVALNIAIIVAILLWTRRATRDRRLPQTITALWAASPFVPYMVLTEWTDSFCVAGFAWWLVLRERHRGWATVALTVGIASKPSVLVLMIPLLLWTREARRELIWAITATLVIVAPFALWTGIPQFVYDTVGVFGDLPARVDGITLDGLATVLGRGLIPGAVLVCGVAAAVVTFTLRRPRDYGSLLAAGAGLVIAVCLFGKQAFLNYYFIAAMGLLFVAGSGRLVPADTLVSPLRELARLSPLAVRVRVGGGTQIATRWRHSGSPDDTRAAGSVR
jgi:hypothetical protein